MQRAGERLTLILAAAVLAWAPLAQGSTFGWGETGLTLLGALNLLSGAVLAIFVPIRTALPWARLWAGVAGLLLGWIWLSVLWAPERHAAITTAGTWTAVLTAAISAACLATTRRRRTALLTVLVLTAAGAVLLAAGQRYGLVVPGFTRQDQVNLSGPFYNPSHFSGFLIGTVALSFTLLLRRPNWTTLPLLALLIAAEAVNLHTDSSSIPAVLLATGLPLLVWIWTRSRLAGALLTALTLLGAAAVTTLFFSPQGQAVFAREQARIGLHRDWGSFLQQREAVWSYGTRMTADHPLLGTGIGQFQSQAAGYRRPERRVGSGMDRAGVNYAHDDALQISSELGFPGLLLFALLLLLPLRQRRGLAARAWWAALPALLLAGIYDAHLTAIPGTAAGMLTLAALAAGNRRAEQVPEAQPPETAAPTPDATHDPALPE